jgi:hypothetical protein
MRERCSDSPDSERRNPAGSRLPLRPLKRTSCAGPSRLSCVALRTTVPCALKSGPSHAGIHRGCPVQAAFRQLFQEPFLRLVLQVASQVSLPSVSTVPRAALKRAENLRSATDRRSIFLPSYFLALNAGIGSLSQPCVDPNVALQRVAKSTNCF